MAMNFEEQEGRQDYLNNKLDDLLEGINASYGQSLLNELVRRLNRTIEDFNEEFGTNFSGDEFDTIGGLVTHTFGHLPTRGERTTLGQLDFVILNADSRRIRLLEVRPHGSDESV